MTKYDLFISCSCEDSSEVNSIVSTLQQRISSLSCYTDTANDEFNDTVKTAIENSSCLLYAQSEISIQTSRVKEEVLYAKKLGKKVFPLLLDGAKIRGWYMFKFGSLEFVDSTKPEAMEKLIADLILLTGKASSDTNEQNVEESVKIDHFNGDFRQDDAPVEAEAEVVDEVDENNNTAPDNSPFRFVYKVNVSKDVENDDSIEEFDVPDSASDYDAADAPDDAPVYDAADAPDSVPDCVPDYDAADAPEQHNKPATELQYINDKKEELAEADKASSPTAQNNSGKLIFFAILALIYLFNDFFDGPKYDTERQFYYNRAAVETDGKWGFIDNEGDEIVAPKYTSVNDFSNGFAEVESYGKWGIVNLEGREIIPTIYDNVSSSAEEGVFIVKSNDKYGLVNSVGRSLTPIKYDKIGVFVNGRAVVELESKNGIIDKDGKEIIRPVYDYADDVKDGFSRVRVNGKWGFVNDKGYEIVPPKYDEANSFSNYRAAVCLNNKWGFIDRKGKEKVVPKFDAVENYHSKRALVCLNGKWGAVDMNGVFVIEPKCDSILQLGGVFKTYIKGEILYLDAVGNRITR